MTDTPSATPAACLPPEEIERLRAEVASLRLTLGGRTFSPDVSEPIGCPMPGACSQVAEIKRLRADIATLKIENDLLREGSVLARARALEGAESACQFQQIQREAMKDDYDDGWLHGVNACIAAIRALAEGASHDPA